MPLAHRTPHPDPPSLHFSLSQDTQKAKQFLPFLQRAGRSEAVVEYVFSGSRLKLFMPKETCLITFLLAGEPAPPPAGCRIGPLPVPGLTGGVVLGGGSLSWGALIGGDQRVQTLPGAVGATPVLSPHPGERGLGRMLSSTKTGEQAANPRSGAAGAGPRERGRARAARLMEVPAGASPQGLARAPGGGCAPLRAHSGCFGRSYKN